MNSDIGGDHTTAKRVCERGSPLVPPTPGLTSLVRNRLPRPRPSDAVIISHNHTCGGGEWSRAAAFNAVVACLARKVRARSDKLEEGKRLSRSWHVFLAGAPRRESK